MQPLRLLIVATATVAVLALIAGFTAESNQDRRGTTSTSETVVAPPPAPTRIVEADLPRERTIVARVGQPIQLTVRLRSVDSLVLDAFGLDETIPAGIPTQVLFTAISPGRYVLRLQDSGRVIGRLDVREASGAGGSGGTTPDREGDEDAAPREGTTTEREPEPPTVTEPRTGTAA